MKQLSIEYDKLTAQLNFIKIRKGQPRIEAGIYDAILVFFIELQKQLDKQEIGVDIAAIASNAQDEVVRLRLND